MLVSEGGSYRDWLSEMYNVGFVRVGSTTLPRSPCCDEEEDTIVLVR